MVWRSERQRALNVLTQNAPIQESVYKILSKLIHKILNESNGLVTADSSPQTPSPRKKSETNVTILSKGVGMAQWVERPTEKPGAILTRVRVPGATSDFSPRDSLQCRLSYGVRTAPVCSRMHQDLCSS